MFCKRPDRSHDQKPTMRRFHLRKPKSLESLGSHDSLSTAPSSVPRTPLSPARHSRIVEFDPLMLHPTHTPPPPRLADRAFIDVGPRKATTGEPRIRGLDASASSPVEHEFSLRLDLLERPTLVRSRWSDSTVHTISDCSSSEEEDDDDESTGDEQEEVETPTTRETKLEFCSDEREVVPAWQNFSLKRNTVAVPRRRPQAGNALDEYVKRGGWKRRGIVFQNSDDNYIERMSSRTVG